MRYKEQREEDEEPQDTARYISDNTAFMHWSTELEETPKVINKKFLEKNRHRVGDLNKFLPLSNITSPKLVKILRLRRMNMTMASEAGLEDIADETMLDNLADCNTSRGIEGFYQKALITQRQELLEKIQSDKKKGFLKSLFEGKEEQEQSEVMQ